jgi:DNA mismatch repair protein MutS2
LLNLRINTFTLIYPESFERKLGIDKIRQLVKAYCFYEPGREQIDNLTFTGNYDDINLRLSQVEEFRQVLLQSIEFPLEHFFDISDALEKARIEGTFLEEDEVFNLLKTVDSVRAILAFLKREESYKLPRLRELAAEVKHYPAISDRINQLLNKHGKIKDSASKDLQNIRQDISTMEASISRRLNQILSKARSQGLIDEDASLVIRDGRAVIPVPAVNKRQIKGYVYDESATGKTVYIEPAEIVEANNDLRELENAERREIVRILIEFTHFIRPYIPELLANQVFMARIDSIRARARFALNINGVKPSLKPVPEIEWHEAVHPLLLLSFRELGKEREVVPLDLKLDNQNRIIIISGPNAGGKSVCLQTVAVLQYMLQCGFHVPMSPNSVAGVFQQMFLDIGDEQSIENDLSTYSSHLLNMKFFTRHAGENSIVFIDEFGTGTEPMLGGAIAEAVLENLNSVGVFGVITTHYTNLKHFAASVSGIINGAMLFDTEHIRPAYKLATGRPGSSFAFEIARKIGLPEEILKNAGEKIGQDRLDFEKHLKDIIRDKRYWENKRLRIRQMEKRLDELVNRYDADLGDTEKLKKKILADAREQAENLLAGANRQIENTIREIREAEAEKEKTREIRRKLEEFREKVKEEDALIARSGEKEDLRRKIEEVKQRTEMIRARRPKQKTPDPAQSNAGSPLKPGDKVLMTGQNTPGEVISLKARKVTVAFGAVKTVVGVEAVHRISEEEYLGKTPKPGGTINLGEWSVGKRKLRFSPDIDIRGKRAEEAIRLITELIDEAVMVRSQELRILHGKGNGILREVVRQYLRTVDVVESFADEHIERGGSGITIVRLGL